MSTTIDQFHDAYEAWERDCLEEFNARFPNDPPRRFTSFEVMEEANGEIWEFVEFSDSGDAYTHGIGGINVIPNAVTPWFNSKHFVE